MASTTMRLPTNTAAVTESSFPRRNSISGLITSRSSSSLRLKYRSLNHNLNLRRRISFQVKCLFGSSEAKQKTQGSRNSRTTRCFHKPSPRAYENKLTIASEHAISCFHEFSQRVSRLKNPAEFIIASNDREAASHLLGLKGRFLLASLYHDIVAKL
ncbi:hypothetical protein MTR_0475s0040 [Medicago truncatula]|uniref:Uncharacterized protein n=1 Tax=Medicago truncatula TaxID=3880 RepID=A0A072TEV1_MEDTR|nr:hypothetical protein MTR_0475s0040 [Medicago truncatula]